MQVGLQMAWMNLTTALHLDRSRPKPPGVLSLPLCRLPTLCPLRPKGVDKEWLKAKVLVLFGDTSCSPF